MFIYNLLTLIIKLFLLAVLLSFIAVSAYLLFVGADLSLLTGQLWFEHDVGSLNLAEAIISRYIYHALWLDWVVPYVLQQPAYLVLPVGTFVSALFTYLTFKL